MSAVRNAILDHLKAGGVITKISAIYPPFSTTNLGDKIYRLRKEGHDIKKRWRTNDNSKWAEFYMLPTIEQMSGLIHDFTNGDSLKDYMNELSDL